MKDNLIFMFLIFILIATLVLGFKTYQNALKDEKNYDNEPYDVSLLFKIRGIGLIFIGLVSLVSLMIKLIIKL